MAFYAYVIYSRSHDRYYKGHCENIESRLKEHNRGNTKSTKAFTPWELMYFEEFPTREEAIKRERYFKTAAGRRYLNKCVKQK